ncbi:helix-turn-helix transcriptional regulator [Microbulbifer spongiae]|uniref:YafY family transcriptional regulator n=1 Tax=Microbulbifer spongiae TaxID=2944933 RepID=A0ABY9EDJ1_9GAMM|nr:YafY family protein [Microbulbifer sp. MI-G]WKD50530.1 YafY family transcriptional regulator [Microbulbifer sp. MI-G]
MRTERLFHLLQILRGYSCPVKGQVLADRLNISIRTLYRDIATLQAQGADIQGEPGLGYILKPGFFLPPLMLSRDEVEAMMLGIRWVSNYGDSPLAKAAGEALAKISAVLPKETLLSASELPLRVGPPASEEFSSEDLSILRQAIRQERKIEIEYQTGDEEKIQHTIWPFAIGYFTDCRILVGWCENSESYRYFQTNKLLSIHILPVAYSGRYSQLFRKWKLQQTST